MTRAVTIKDVAEKAGVSPTAVSFAMTGKGRLSVETRARILAVADELGYRRNPAAMALRSGSTNTIGVFMPLFSAAEKDPSLAAYWHHAVAVGTRHAADRGYAMVMLPPEATSIPGTLRLCAVIAAELTGEEPLLDSLRTAGVPLVAPQTAGAEPDITIDFDYVAGAAAILAALPADAVIGITGFVDDFNMERWMIPALSAAAVAAGLESPRVTRLEDTGGVQESVRRLHASGCTAFVDLTASVDAVHAGAPGAPAVIVGPMGTAVPTGSNVLAYDESEPAMAAVDAAIALDQGVDQPRVQHLGLWIE